MTDESISSGLGVFFLGASFDALVILFKENVINMEDL